MKQTFKLCLLLIIALALTVSCRGSKSGSGKDSGGKKIKSVVIGNQEWMADNLDVTVFRDGSEIEHIDYEDDWSDVGKDKEPGWCYYDMNEDDWVENGKFYNWYAVSDPRGLCPEGWRVPSDADWQELIDYLGGAEAAYDKIKSKTGWDNDDNGTNESGFNAKPAGLINVIGEGVGAGKAAYWWASDAVGARNAAARLIYPGYRYIYRDALSRSQGHSVRCIREQ